MNGAPGHGAGRAFRRASRGREVAGRSQWFKHSQLSAVLSQSVRIRSYP
jgi:hypothetical protein